MMPLNSVPDFLDILIKITACLVKLSGNMRAGRLIPPFSPFLRGMPKAGGWGARGDCIHLFIFGETISTDLANYNGADEKYGAYGKGEKGEYRQTTTEVDYFDAANEFGLSDMHGNVWEWCAAPRQDNYQDAPLDGRVWDEEKNNDNCDDSSPRVIRGGSWGLEAYDCRSAYRSDIVPDLRSLNNGFRVVRG